MTIDRILTLAAVALLSLLTTACSNPYTPAGHEGYVFERPRLIEEGGFQGMISGPGNFGVSPLRNHVINLDLRPETYTEEFKILAKDDLNVSFDVHLVLAIEPGRVQSVVLEYGGVDWYARFVKESFRTLVRTNVQNHASREIKQARELIATDVREALAAYLAQTPFQIRSLVVGNIDYPPIVAKAVAQKLASLQPLEEKATQREIAKRDAELRVEEAKGIAEAQRIINATLTPNYLQHEAIEAQLRMADAPNHTTVYIPVGTNGIPLVEQLQR
jgi:hypothetical protein